jgi:choline dehydrogenase-like flavoprotein
VRNRPNLTVRTRANATKVLVRDGRAVGLEYLQGGSPRAAYADAEVIVSAGAINSPRLLLLSGIGPADELRALGIDVVADVPGVGKNLHDQLEVYITAECAEPVSYSGEDRWHRAALHAVQYGLFRTGPATATITEAGAFLHSREGLGSPDIQLHMLPAYVVWEDYQRTAQRMPGHGITILACNVRPRSRGSVTLASADPAALPNVDPNYLDDPADWTVAVDGFRWIRKVLAAPAFAPYLKQEQLPGAGVQTDAEIRDYIRRYGKTDYHPVGSCKMGADELAVVDERLRVRGLDGLRVVDSSIMPSIISGNTQAPAMVIGEKGSAMILADRAEKAAAAR